MKKKLLFTLGILFLYIMLRHIPLLGVAASEQVLSSTDLFQNMITGASNQSIFILGLGPWMIANLAIGVYSLFNREKLLIYSQKEIMSFMYRITFVVAVIQAVYQLTRLSLDTTVFGAFTMYVVFIEMLLGVLIIVILAKLNENYGIGAMTVFVLVNIFASHVEEIGAGIELVQTQSLSYIWSHYQFQIVYLIVAFIIVLYLMKTELHIPVERIMIHNSFKKNSYISYSLNPIGMMPLMFGMIFFMIPGFIFALLATLLPNVGFIQTLVSVWQIDNEIGIWIFYASFILLNVLMAFVYLDPKHTSESMEKAGDCISGILPGKDTENYLKKVIRRQSMLSGFIMGALLLIPIYMDMYSNGVTSNYSMVSTVLIVLGLMLNLIDEVRTNYVKDRYEKSGQFKKKFGL